MLLIGRCSYYFESVEAFEAFFEGDLSVNSAKGSIDLRSIIQVTVSTRKDLGRAASKQGCFELRTAHRTWIVSPEENSSKPSAKTRTAIGNDAQVR